MEAIYSQIGQHFGTHFTQPTNNFAYELGLGFRYSLGVALFIFVWKLLSRLLGSSLFGFIDSRNGSVGLVQSNNIQPVRYNNHSRASSSSAQIRSSGVVSEVDLKYLIDNLDAKLDMNDGWENVIDKRNDSISYSAKCCKQKDGPIKYLSVTVFEGCLPEILRDFYMDNNYRKMWDKTLIDHRQLEVDGRTGTEIGQMVKKFPLLTPREYVLAWRVWEGKNQSFYCFSKEYEHPLVPRQKKYVRVGFFRSGWRIRKVPGRDACEIKMVHQEDSGLNVEMAKLAFARGIWSYVCKMDNALRKYSPRNPVAVSPAASAITLMQKVPPELDNTEDVNTPRPAELAKPTLVCRQVAHDRSVRKLSRRPSSKLIANGIVLLGGAICLSRGHSNLGAKVAMAYILSKFSKRGLPTKQNGHLRTL
ncbi:hypothetical protein LIER_32637 [Lithospermum erythrorhizon]|uniref:START domain-containing protein n=1 Tax=Lithospermum erythrorhizon TaxID=34254 RepID=A0AAV3RVC0_LITER